MTDQTNGGNIIVSIGTFPPTDEGIATFNNDLLTAIQKMLGNNAECMTYAINLSNTSPYYFDNRVMGEIDQENLDMYIEAATRINENTDVKAVIIHHEYGIFGGEWGEYIVKFLENLKKPVITVMHTVLETHPYKTKKFKEVTDLIVERSYKLVVLTKKSKSVLSSIYPSASDKISYISHGIHPILFSLSENVKQDLGLSGKTVLTTFGLLSRDKGIEYVLKALPAVVEKNSNILYQFVGQTHPIIRRNEGEEYRNELVSLVKKLNLRKNVRFIDRYLELGELLKYLQGTDLYIATSVNKDQSVSGTLSYALGAGRAVVSTFFVQSTEIVTKSMGRLVMRKDPKAYSDAIIEILSDKTNLLRMHRNAYTKTRSMLWTNIAKKYIDLVADLDTVRDDFYLPELNLTHLHKMTKRFGILQFANHSLPDTKSGFTLDDNARALIVLVKLLEKSSENIRLKRLFRVYFRFMNISQKNNGSFINYFDYDLNPTDQNTLEDPLEHHGRSLWALAETLQNSLISPRLKKQARKMWDLSFKSISNFQDHLRPRAFIIKAAAIFHEGNNKYNNELREDIINNADYLADKFHENKAATWLWFENTISYNNAILPESLALAYKITGNKKYLMIAKKTIGFLIKKTFMDELYVPVGERNWYKRGKLRSLFDQQPEEASALVTALITMYEITNNQKYIEYAKNAFSWFLGNNLNGLPLYNYKTGGVYDGLTKSGVNKNQGAESLLSYLLARLSIEKYVKL